MLRGSTCSTTEHRS